MAQDQWNPYQWAGKAFELVLGVATEISTQDHL